MSHIESVLSHVEAQWPDTPDPWPAVAAALDPARPRGGVRRRPVARWAVAAAALVAALALGGALVGTLPVVAEGLGIGVVDIKTGPIEDVTATLDLGAPAVGATDAPVPSLLGAPDAVYEAPGVVWLVYRPRPDLPEVLTTGVGALIARIDGEGILEKVVDPTVTSRTDVTVNGAAAVWLEGGSHELLVQRSDGAVISSIGRLAGNTLLWVADGVTYRLEVAVPFERALEIATSMEP